MFKVLPLSCLRLSRRSQAKADVVRPPFFAEQTQFNTAFNPYYINHLATVL